MSRLAAPLGLAVASVRQVPLFDGSLQVMLRHADADGGFEMADPSVKVVLDDEATGGVGDPDRLGGLHAAALRSGTALHDYLVDQIPGCGVPIRPVEDLRAARPDTVLILTWDIADKVISQLEADGGWGAEYLVPMPAPHVIAR